MPRITHDSDPSPGVATINAAARKAGFKSRCTDFNHILYRELFDRSEVFYEIDRWMCETYTTTLKFQPQDSLSSRAHRELLRIFELWLKEVEEANPRFLGLGLFSRNSKRTALAFLEYLKRKRPRQKIILGGAGTSPAYEPLRKQVDYYVEGEAEDVIVKILQSTPPPLAGVNGVPPVQSDDLDLLPWPDYSDFPLEEYQNRGKKLRITGSRGCTRRCNFCNVYKIWPKYRYRSGKSLAAEILHQHLSLPTRPDHFIFTDSLINGKIQALREMCDELIRFQASHGLNIKFEGQFIAVEEKAMASQDYQRLRQAGAYRLYVGYESGSEKIRFAMNKRIKDSALDFSIRQLSLQNIRMLWYLIVGHPLETEEEFEKTRQLLKTYAHLNRQDYRIQVTLHEYSPLEGTDWHSEFGHTLQWNAENDWVSSLNPKLDRKQRILRLLTLEEDLKRWGYDHWQPSLLAYPQTELKQILKEAKGLQSLKQLQHLV